MNTRLTLAGRWVGDLRVLWQCEDRKTPSRNVEQWVCRCRCGSIQKRMYSNIVHRMRNNANMCCYRCRIRDRRTKDRVGKGSVDTSILCGGWWRRYGSLHYDWSFDDDS
ncbi:MAG: hypothetical protein ACXABY_19205, partial [Candidatus Thorarchaeota archaeon]